MPARVKTFAPSTVLAAAMLARRAGQPAEVVAPALGVHLSTLLRLERGYAPSAPTVLKLARWLGWTMEQVMEAANLAPPP